VPDAAEHPLLPVALAALEHYPLDVTAIEPLADQTNALFRIRTSNLGTRVLRVGVGGAVRHPASVIESEMMFLEALGSETDIAAPHPTRNRSGALVTLVPDPDTGETRTCVVFSWMPGLVLATALSAEAMEQFGRTAAALHRFGVAFRPPIGFTIPRYASAFPYDRPVVLFDSPLVGEAVRRRCRAMAGKVEEAIERLAQREKPGIIHGDLYAWNAMLHEGTVGLFDFEEMLWGWPVQDVAGTFFTLWQHPQLEDFFVAYRRGYETIGEWPERVPGEITMFMAARSLMLANDVLLQPEWQHEVAEILGEAMDRFDLALS
jgi:Ser/Thr protein kinase RdoA (MazF antagonist)